MDFVNTVSGKRLLSPIERLNAYVDLVSWGEQLGVVEPAVGKTLRRSGRDDPERAEAVLRRAKELREVLFRVFSAVAADEEPAKADMDRFNQELAHASARLRVMREKDGFVWAYAEEEALESMLFPVMRSAADILTSGDLSRVRMCEADDGCGWLFYDETRNGQRRWCSMKDCGNRAKARRHYAKNKDVSE